MGGGGVGWVMVTGEVVWGGNVSSRNGRMSVSGSGIGSVNGHGQGRCNDLGVVVAVCERGRNSAG